MWSGDDRANQSTMDRVAVDFRERVAALWKCCDSVNHREGCLDARVPDCQWTMKSKKKRIDFVIGEENDEWSYRFTNPDRTEGVNDALSMDELKKNPNLQHVRIQRIEVTDNAESSINVLRSLEEVQRLMKFVVLLSNEPQLELCTFRVYFVGSPEGVILLNSLSNMTFSSFWATYYCPDYDQILENQFSRRKPTTIHLKRQLRNSEFVVQHLRNGNIQKFHGPFNFRFPAEVMERIINRFLENPEFYDKNQFHIEAEFEESTRKMLEMKRKEGRCARSRYRNFALYRFKANNPELKKNPCLSIRFSADDCIISID